MNFYPLELKPVIKSAIWGGTKIANEFSIGEKDSKSAEAWMLSLRDDGVNIIENGAYSGESLDDYINIVGKENVYGDGDFPLLIKILDAEKSLSVQVHPDDEYAKNNNLDAGKTEMWYILDCKNGAKLVAGIDENVSMEELKESCENGDCEKYLKYIPVKKGDTVFIPAGLVHAIGEGILIAEIQQNSNTTYRLYDFNRTDSDGKKRELHIERATEVIKKEFDLTNVKVDKEIFSGKGVSEKIVCECEYFSVKKYTFEGETTHKSFKRGKMGHILCVSGSGYIECDNIKYVLVKGKSYLLPKALGEISVTSDESLEIIYTI